MNLVFINNNRPVTDSLTVAATFEKEHRRVMQDIRELECSSEFSLHNFVLSNYMNDRGREYDRYLITQDGFAFLAMGYTGKEAARFKEIYIGEFNRMKEKLINPSSNEIRDFLLNPDTIIKIAENWKEEKRLRIAAESVIESQKPLVFFAESLQVSKDTVLIGELAKLLKQNGIEIGAIRLFEQLRQDGYLHKSGSQRNLPTQKSMELGLMEIKVGSRSSISEGTKITKTTKITGKGQMYFINRYRQIGQEA